MATIIIEALDNSATIPDQLIVRGTVNGAMVEATGWLSAMTNHFDGPNVKPADYDAAGNRKATAVPRPMNLTEKLAYFTDLLEKAAPKAPQSPNQISLIT